MSNSNQHNIVFDGVCNFCNAAVNFIIKRDPHARYIFTPMQSSFAQSLIAEHCAETVGIDTFLLVKNGKAYLWTNAALEIAKDLSGLWKWFNLLRIIPTKVRNACYRPFARNRLRIFGGRKVCRRPSEYDYQHFVQEVVGVRP